MATAPRVTIVFDNRPGLSGCSSQWGFAALIETEDKTILFDTGSNGRTLLKNMAALGCAVHAVDLIFLSHPHWDHMGGLDSVLEMNAGVEVVLNQSFSAHLIRDLRPQCREVVVVGVQPRRLAPGVFSTGQLESQPPEHGLVLEFGGVTAAIAGCAHAGMERIVERGVAVLERPIQWAIGGFHLTGADSAEIARCVRALQDLGVTDVVPTHCTGDAARAAFKRAYGERCKTGGVGRVLELSAYERPGR